MGALEKVYQLKKEGLSERDIISKLQAEGNSPKEIMDALNQAQIKQAVSTEEDFQEDMTPSVMQIQEDDAPTPNQEQSPPKNQDYQQNTPPPEQQEELYSPQTPYQQSSQLNQDYYTPQQREEEYYNYEDSPQEEVYEEEQYYEPEEENYNPTSIIEIAEQVFAEKTKKMHRQLRELIETKTILETKVEDLSDRLKRMEKVFDKMQLTIINKVSQYGEGLQTMKKEMNMIEDSFSKLINPLIEKQSQTNSHKK